MRQAGVSVTLLLLLTVLSKVTLAEDIYWEGDDDATEFLEVKNPEDSLFGHLKRIKRQFNIWNFFTPTEAPAPENLENVTEDDEIAPDNGDDDSNTEGSGVPDNRVESDFKERTIRATFNIMEPYRTAYSNRDSEEFQELSKDLADAVNVLYESIPGSQRASLVRIQSRLSDNFSCKVTIDIVTTGFDDYGKIIEVLRQHINNRRRLGDVPVSDSDFSANIIDPGATLETCDPDKIQCDDGSCIFESKRCDGNIDCADFSDEAGCPRREETNPATEHDPYTDRKDEENAIDNDDGFDQKSDYNPESENVSPDSGSRYDPKSNTFGGSDTYAGGNNVDNTNENRQKPDEGDETNRNTDKDGRGDQSLELPTVEDNTTRRPKNSDRENQVCPDNTFMCDVTRCLEPSRRCDGHRDCYDETDENDCPSEPKICGNDDFRCSSGMCIESSRRCDRVFDCPEREDEANCECREDEFTCADGTCIELRKRCDNYSHCPDGSDERDCTCSADHWQCDHGSCISRSRRCDGHVDCPTDRSDERNCIDNRYFKCKSGNYILDSLRCNRQYDCPRGDYSDEQNCPCVKGDFKCNNGHCIPASKHCDRTHDCQDGSDERHCIYGTVCMAYQYKCTSGKCVQAESWCNGTAECDDGSDEMNCPCKRGQFPCRDGSCINIALRCNGQKDCASGEDEFNCDLQTCPAGSIQCNLPSWNVCARQCDGIAECANGEDEDGCQEAECNHKCDGRCLEDYLICNGSPDCKDGSDEASCYHCDGVDDFRCRSGECISASLRCNNDYDCEDFSDERDCNVTVTPTPTGCLDNQFTCGDGQCIDKQFVCDDHRDCNDNTDEDNCRCIDPENFQCRSGQCIEITKLCNGADDCTDGSDEYNCPPITTTPYPNRDQLTPAPFTTTTRPGVDYPGYPYGSRPYDSGSIGSGPNGAVPDNSDPYGPGSEGPGPYDSGSNGVGSNGQGPYDSGSNGAGSNGPGPYDTGSNGASPNGQDPYDSGSNGAGPNVPGPYDTGSNGAGPNGQDPYDSGSNGAGPNGPGPYDTGSNGAGPNGQGPYDSGSNGAGPNGPGPYDSGSNGAGPNGPGPYDTSSNGAGPNGQDPYDSDSNGSGPNGPGPYDTGSNGAAPNGQGPYDSGSNGAGPDGSGPNGSGSSGPYDSGSNGAGPDGSGPYDSGSNGAGPDGSGSHGAGSDGSGPGSGSSGPYDSGSNGAGPYDSGSNGAVPVGSGGYDSGSYGSDPNYPYSTISPASQGTRRPSVWGRTDGRGDVSGESNQGGDSGPRGPPFGSYGGSGYPTFPGSGSNIGGSGSTSLYGQPGSACAWYQWKCERGQCIDSRQRCNGRIDCPFDVSDEFNCPDGSPVSLDLHTRPDSQSIKYGGDVVFQCRDEGPLRAPVRWVREYGKPLKPGYIERNGRLELFNVTLRDAGTYICQTTKYLGLPGSEKRVTLEVERAVVTQPPLYGCKPYEATCANGECIPKSSVCDGRRDCSDNSDEEACQHNGMCEPNEFECANKKCILKTWRCDSEDDCGDGSDEEACDQPIPGQPCLPSEFSCTTLGQCIPKSYHCDHLKDCMDGSDEVGCDILYVSRPPSPANLRLNPGDTMTLTCEAVGVPIPLISWRLNWGHVPNNCISTSNNGVGTLTCPDMQPQHSGAYSCEAINNKGTIFAVPDAIVHVNRSDPCPTGYFNSEARSQNECIRCFCFGESTQCRSADLFTYNMPTPLGTGGTRMVGVVISPNGDVRTDGPITSNFDYQPLMNGAAVTKLSGPTNWQGWSRRDAHPYVTLPESYNGNQLTSYGGKIRFSLSSHADVNMRDNAVPTIIIKGKYGVLFYTFTGVVNGKIDLETRLTPENWEKSGPRGSEPASREDIMMALDYVELILLRGDMNNAGVNISNFVMESAQHINVGLGAASLVEECTCPSGYEGLSCEKCAAGYKREQSGPWLGNCVRETCPPGTYGDPASGYACRPCPCPLTNKENQFARTCALGSDGQVACDCNPGYEGKNCEVCAAGYEGNPLLRGDSCVLAPQDNCNKVGTRQVKLLDECECKDNVQGRYCDQCKNDSFYLSKDFRHGCALCFCSGVTQQCRSSNLRRKTTNVQFNMPQIVQDVKLFSSAPADPYSAMRYANAIETDIKPDLYRGTVMVRSFPRTQSAVYYWSLPNSFAGDKVTSYGGYLRYTLEGVPVSAASNSRNDPDVQLISDNHLTFHYVGQFTSTYDGVLNASVQLLEQGWQRADGKDVSREHFLLALADVKTILIKASYSPDVQLATPLTASIETAEENGDGPMALHVEKCVCPEGYAGTSCEDCAPGYTRSSSGLYLEHCGRCDCNGHSTMCNPESGICYDCTDNTDGPHCEDCKPGYEHDYNGECISMTLERCQCNPDGVDRIDSCDASGECQCKANVEGMSCDTCRPGTFGLDSENPHGCLNCYCSGVTNKCHEGSHYTRVPMAAPIFGPNYGGYTLMDLNADVILNDHFVPVPDKSELMYVFSYPPDMELFWSLPVFPGNRVLSYNGILSLKQEFRSDGSSVSEPGTDIILVGDDISLYWSRPEAISPEQPMAYVVPLRETDWYVLNSASPASRSQFMQVLKNLRRVLVRATLVRNIVSTTIADVSMDTATENFNGAPSAKGVEVCMCPTGYTGTSCEGCAPQFYHDLNGKCKRCPCNGHDCQLDNYGQVSCNCLPPYTGPSCATVGLIMELHPTIHHEGNGTFKQVTLTCKYRAPEPLTISFYHEDVEQWPPKYYNESVLHTDGWHGEHVWQTVWDTRRQGETYECHTLTVKGFTLGVLTTSLPEPGPEVPPPPVSPDTNPPKTTVIARISSPSIKIQEVGSSVNFTCEAHSIMTRNRLRVKWNKVDGLLPQDRSHVDEVAGILFITGLQVSDSGEYICTSTDGVTSQQAVATLKVPGVMMTEPRVTISVPEKDYQEGDRVEIRCVATGVPKPTISWQRAGNQPLPVNSQQYEDLLVINNVRMEDAGEYRCIASNTLGTRHSTVLVTVKPRPHVIIDRITTYPNSTVVDVGQSINVVCTGTPGVPTDTLDWIRQDSSPLQDNIQVDRGILYINNARPENQGVYICLSTSSDAPPATALITVNDINVEPGVEPNITVSVDSLKIPTGESGTVDCNPLGSPLPMIKWTKYGGSFGPGASQRGNTLILNRVNDDDAGYYMCEGTVNGDVISSIYVYVEIERREPPRVEIWPPGEQAVPLDSQYEMHCRVLAGIPEPDILWSRSSGRSLSTHVQLLPHNILKFEKVEVNDEGEYMCTASNIAGSESATSIIKVRAPPEIMFVPSNYITVKSGQNVTVNCRASGYPEPRVSIKSNVDQRELVPPTPSTAYLRITSATTRDEGDYTCTASSAAGTTEDQFFITVEKVETIENIPDEEGSGDPGDIIDVENPSPMVALDGQNMIQISCENNGYEVRWSRDNGEPLQWNAQPNGAVLTINNLSKADSGTYVCNLYNRLTDELQLAAKTRLVVISPPNITLRPSTQTVHPGESPTVECVADGDDIIDVTWNLDRRAQLSNRVQADGRMLIFRNIEVEDAGKYECVARNSIANVTAIAEVVVTEDTDRAPIESHDNEQYARVGATVHLSCNATQPGMTVTWTKDGRSIPRNVVQKRDGSLYIRLAQKSDSGRYVCQVFDHNRSRTSNFINLNIEGPPTVASPLVSLDQSRRTYRIGEDVNVLCKRRTRNVSIKWVKYGTNEYVDYREYGDGAMLIVPGVQVTDAGVYRCIGTGTYGSSYEDFQLDVEGGHIPDINSRVYPDHEPNPSRTRYTARFGDTVDLPCNHNLEQPVRIEWSKEFSPLPSKTRTDQPILRLERITEADSGTYVCHISNNRASMEARAILQVEGVVPRFNGESWLSLPALKDPYRQFDIEISIKPADANGLILYNSENRDKTGDYLALQLIDGVPQFIVDSGTGPLEVKGDHPLQLNTWHTIRLSRTNSRITMNVGQSGPFVAETDPSNSRWVVLELNEPLYVGGTPYSNQLPEALAGASGFIGCVSMLVLGRDEKNIMTDSLEKYQVDSCDSCSPNLCLNDGVCQEYLNELGYICICAPGFAGQNCSRTGEACRMGLCGPGKCIDTSDGYKCVCPVTQSGRNCESKQNIEYPAFTGSAYFAIKPPDTSRSLKMAMKIKAMSPVTDGIIMYCAESSRGYGGFTSLTVHNGRLEYTYDLGKGGSPVVLTSSRMLTPNEWADINIARVGALVSLKINTNQNYEQTLESPNSILNFETDMFVGGVDESIVLNKNLGVSAGFSGCIKDLKLHGTAIDFMNSSTQSVNVQDCQRYNRGDIPELDGNCQCKNGGSCTSDYSACSCPPGFSGQLCEVRSLYPQRPPPRDPCVFHPCRNGGTCRFDPTSKLNHTCDCFLGYAGDLCQMRLELLQSVGFNGNGYVELPSDLIEFNNLDSSPAVIAMAIHTTTDGVLLYQRELGSRPNQGDFIILRVDRGFVTMEWDLGSGVASLVVDDVYINDGERHQIVAKMERDNLVTLTVDSDFTKTGVSIGISNVMNADSNIYIGGIPDSYNFRRYPGLTGCIEQIELMDTSRGLYIGRVAVAGRNAQKCKEYRH